MLYVLFTMKTINDWDCMVTILDFDELAQEFTRKQYDFIGIIDRSDYDSVCKNDDIDFYDIMEISDFYDKTTLYKNAISKLAFSLSFIPDYDKTYALCVHAVTTHSMAMDFVPARYLNKKFYTDLVNLKPQLLEHIPIKFKTDVLCFMAIKADISTIIFVPKKILTPEFRRTALVINKDSEKYLKSNHNII